MEAPLEAPTHKWPKCIPGGSRMDGGWSSSERTKFTCVEGASLCGGWGQASRESGAYRSAVGHSSRMEFLDL